MTESEELFLKEVQNAVRAGDASRLSDAVSDFSAFCFKETLPSADSPLFSDDFLNELIKLIATPDFLALADSFKLLALFQNDWGRLSPDQRAQLCRFLATIYEQLQDNTAQLVIAELLGEYLASDESLQALDKLSQATDEVARAHVAHGFKCLALNAPHPELRVTARSHLTAMANDASGVVREEVASALADLASQ